MQGRAQISPGVLERYAADAARDADGVLGLVERKPGRRAIRVRADDDRVGVELHVRVAWGASIPAVAGDVQRRVADYLARMAEVTPSAIDVVVDEIGPG